MESPIHKVCGTRHWSTEACPAMKSTAARMDVQGRSDPSAPTGRNERASGLEIAAHVAGEKRKPEAGTQAPPVDTKEGLGTSEPADKKPPVVRSTTKADVLSVPVAVEARIPSPSTKFDKVAYQREYMRKRRAEIRAPK